MEIEKALTFSKPKNHDRHLKILGYFGMVLGNHSRTPYVHINPVPEEIIREHYINISQLPIYEPTIDAYTDPDNGGIVATIISGPGIISRGRYVIGDKDPKKAEPWTVRAVFCGDSIKLAWNQRRYFNNTIHVSDEDNAEREIKLWRPMLRI
jgi:nucleoside diphosphate kinase